MSLASPKKTTMPAVASAMTAIYSCARFSAGGTEAGCSTIVGCELGYAALMDDRPIGAKVGPAAGADTIMLLVHSEAGLSHSTAVSATRLSKTTNGDVAADRSLRPRKARRWLLIRSGNAAGQVGRFGRGPKSQPPKRCCKSRAVVRADLSRLMVRHERGGPHRGGAVYRSAMNKALADWRTNDVYFRRSKLLMQAHDVVLCIAAARCRARITAAADAGAYFQIARRLRAAISRLPEACATSWSSPSLSLHARAE